MAKDFIPHMCGRNKIYIPNSGCDDCTKLELRVEALEDIIEKKIELALYDNAQGSITAQVLGEVIE